MRKHFWAEITILSRQSNTTNELELKKQQRDKPIRDIHEEEVTNQITKWLRTQVVTNLNCGKLSSTYGVTDVDSGNIDNTSDKWSNSIK